MPARPRLVPAAAGTIAVAALVEAVQAAAVLGASVYVALDAVLGNAEHVQSAVALAVVGVLCAAGMAAVVRGLWTAERWSRAPAVLTQIFAVIIAVSMFQGEQTLIGAGLIATAAPGLIALFHPKTTQVLLEEPED